MASTRSARRTTAGNQAISTSQLALSLTSDNVFGDGWESQLATVSGSADSMLTASLFVRV